MCIICSCLILFLLCILQVRNYHKEFYRPENLKIIITGQVKPEDVFKALAPLEDKILTKVNKIFIDGVNIFLNISA